MKPNATMARAASRRSPWEQGGIAPTHSVGCPCGVTSHAAVPAGTGRTHSVYILGAALAYPIPIQMDAEIRVGVSESWNLCSESDLNQKGEGRWYLIRWNVCRKHSGIRPT